MSESLPRWTDLSADPNTGSVLALNQRMLDASRRSPVANRNRYLAELAQGRRVLDVGGVEHTRQAREAGRWLHRHLVDAAAACVGVDVLADEVRALQSEGYDVRLHDITEAALPEKFDLVVAGEIVEHLGSPEALLRNARAMLLPGGRLVLTTPNPYMLHRAWRGLRGEFRESADHVTLFGPSHLLELGRRCGLRLVCWRGVELRITRTPRGRVVGHARRALSRTIFRPEINCETMIYEFTE